jgi:large subunit ribosomal protein L3
MKFILGQKIGMTRIFDEEGRNFAVTKVRVLPCTVSKIITKDHEGYKAVQIKATKQSGEKEKIVRINEFRVDAPNRYKVGEAITLKQFKAGELVTVTGTSKGKGFSGTIKRHGFHRGPAGHGSNNVREPGSIGAQQPQRVVLGKKMAGKMGVETVTVKNLRLVDLDNEIMLIAGSIPGNNKSIVKVFGMGEKAEEIIDTVAIEEALAMEKMKEDAAAEKAEKAEDAEEKSEITNE